MGVNIQVAGRVAGIEGVQELLPAPMRAQQTFARVRAMVMAACPTACRNHRDQPYRARL